MPVAGGAPAAGQVGGWLAPLVVPLAPLWAGGLRCLGRWLRRCGRWLTPRGWAATALWRVACAAWVGGYGAVVGGLRCLGRGLRRCAGWPAPPRLAATALWRLARAARLWRRGGRLPLPGRWLRRRGGWLGLPELAATQLWFLARAAARRRWAAAPLWRLARAAWFGGYAAVAAGCAAWLVGHSAGGGWLDTGLINASLSRCLPTTAAAVYAEQDRAPACRHSWHVQRSTALHCVDDLRRRRAGHGLAISMISIDTAAHGTARLGWARLGWARLGSARDLVGAVSRGQGPRASSPAGAC